MSLSRCLDGDAVKPHASAVNTHRPLLGFLIAIEGIDGAGKTTQARFVQFHLEARKLAVIRTKEPTTGRWGQILRDSALTGRLSLEEEVDAFIKDRKEHVETVIKPAIAAGQIVIVDRYYFSTIAYQGARGYDTDELMRINEEFAPEPDLLVLLDVEPKIGLERVRKRGDRANHFEKTDTLKRARAIFNKLEKPYLCRLDATKPPEELRDLIVKEFSLKAANQISSSGATVEEQFRAAQELFGAHPGRLTSP